MVHLGNPPIAHRPGASTRTPDPTITVMHLGRGGVQKDGTLDQYNRTRVEETLCIARLLGDQHPDRPVRIIWSGKCNRKQDRSGIAPIATEAKAALDYATSQLLPTDTFSMLVEENSTSTVENAVFTAQEFPSDGLLVVLSDPLHYRGGKVAFIMRLVFSDRSLRFITLTEQPGVSKMGVVKHFISVITTRAGMIGVRRGNLSAIEKRQKRLERITGH